MTAIRYSLILVLFISGCVKSSGVLKMGPDTYSINVEAINIMKSRQIAYEAANQECEQQDRVFLVKSWSQIVDRGIYDMIFRCLPKGDPELSQRPNYESRPDVVIKDERK